MTDSDGCLSYDQHRHQTEDCISYKPCSDSNWDHDSWTSHTIGFRDREEPRCTDPLLQDAALTTRAIRAHSGLGADVRRRLNAQPRKARSRDRSARHPLTSGRVEWCHTPSFDQYCGFNSAFERTRFAIGLEKAYTIELSSHIFKFCMSTFKPCPMTRSLSWVQRCRSANCKGSIPPARKSWPISTALSDIQRRHTRKKASSFSPSHGLDHHVFLAG